MQLSRNSQLLIVAIAAVALAAIAACVFLMLDSPSTQPDTGTTASPSPTVTVSDKPTPDTAEYRVLLASDTHYLSGERMTDTHNWGGTISDDERLQQWVDAVLTEHQRHPFDLILLLGDYSLDWWGEAGTWQVEGFSDTQKFFDKYVSQLPQDVPIFIAAGNHEPYSNEEWIALSGNSRQGAVTLGNNVFVILDAFDNGTLGDKASEPGYTGPDIQYVQQQLDRYEGCNVYLCGHRLYGQPFASLIANNEQIKAIIYGDTHRSIAWTETYGGNTVTVAETGQFSYSNDAKLYLHGWNRGFRDLIINRYGAFSNYIIAAHHYEENGRIKYVDRKVINSVQIY